MHAVATPFWIGAHTIQSLQALTDARRIRFSLHWMHWRASNICLIEHQHFTFNLPKVGILPFAKLQVCGLHTVGLHGHVAHFPLRKQYKTYAYFKRLIDRAQRKNQLPNKSALNVNSLFVCKLCWRNDLPKKASVSEQSPLCISVERATVLQAFSWGEHRGLCTHTSNSTKSHNIFKGQSNLWCISERDTSIKINEKCLRTTWEFSRTWLRNIFANLSMINEVFFVVQLLAIYITTNSRYSAVWK